MCKPYWHNPGFVAIAAQRSTALVAFTLLLAYGCSDRSSNPPAAVTQALAALYPDAVVVWQAKSYGYEGIFYRNGVKYEAEFAADGSWLETEREVSAAAFSQAVRDRVRQEYPGYTITKYEIEQTPQGTFYEVEIKQNNSEYELYFDATATPARNAHEDS